MAASASPSRTDKLSLTHLLGQSYAPTQLAFITAPENEVAWVGGWGCGKTFALCAAAFRHCMKHPGAVALLCRFTYDEMVKSTKKQFFEMVDVKGLGEFIVKPKRWDYREKTHNVRFTNGSELWFSNLDKSIHKHKNIEYSFIGIDQAEEDGIGYETYQALRLRCRLNAVPGALRQVMCIANDEGDNWLRRRFLTFEPPHNRPTADDTRRLFTSTSLENPHLDQHARANLLNLPPEVQRRYVFATMDAGSTRLIPDFTVVEPFEVPRHWPRFLGVDPARSTGTTCALWVTVNPDNQPWKGVKPNAPHFYAEYWADGREAEVHAEAINRVTGPHNLRGRVMDRTSWASGVASRRFGSINVAQLYINAGLPVAPSDGDEWARVMLFLEAHKRGLTVSKACPHLIRQGPEYRIHGQELYRPGQAPAKIVAKSKFHAIDAGGYALACVPTRVTAVDVRETRPMYEIAADADLGSRLHWERERSALPKMRGQQQVQVLGMDEAELFQDSMPHQSEWWERDEEVETW